MDIFLAIVCAREFTLPDTGLGCGSSAIHGRTKPPNSAQGGEGRLVVKSLGKRFCLGLRGISGFRSRERLRFALSLFLFFLLLLLLALTLFELIVGLGHITCFRSDGRPHYHLIEP